MALEKSFESVSVQSKPPGQPCCDSFYFSVHAIVKGLGKKGTAMTEYICAYVPDLHVLRLYRDEESVFEYNMGRVKDVYADPDVPTRFELRFEGETIVNRYMENQDFFLSNSIDRDELSRFIFHRASHQCATLAWRLYGMSTQHALIQIPVKLRSTLSSKDRYMIVARSRILLFRSENITKLRHTPPLLCIWLTHAKIWCEGKSDIYVESFFQQQSKRYHFSVPTFVYFLSPPPDHFWFDTYAESNAMRSLA